MVALKILLGHLNVAFNYPRKMRRCYPLDEFLSRLPVDAVFDTRSGTFGCIIRSTKTNGRRLIFQNMLCCKNMYWVLECFAVGASRMPTFC